MFQTLAVLAVAASGAFAAEITDFRSYVVNSHREARRLQTNICSYSTSVYEASLPLTAEMPTTGCVFLTNCTIGCGTVGTKCMPSLNMTKLDPPEVDLANIRTPSAKEIEEALKKAAELAPKIAEAQAKVVTTCATTLAGNTCLSTNLGDLAGVTNAECKAAMVALDGLEKDSKKASALADATAAWITACQQYSDEATCVGANVATQKAAWDAAATDYATSGARGFAQAVVMVVALVALTALFF